VGREHQVVSARGSTTTQGPRASRPRVAEQAVKTNTVIHEVTEAGLASDHPVTIAAKQIRLESLKVKADLEQELRPARSQLHGLRPGGSLGPTRQHGGPRHWGHRFPAPHGEPTCLLGSNAGLANSAAGEAGRSAPQFPALDRASEERQTLSLGYPPFRYPSREPWVPLLAWPRPVRGVRSRGIGRNLYGDRGISGFALQLGWGRRNTH
jgi:hypothetical protein